MTPRRDGQPQLASRARGDAAVEASSDQADGQEHEPLGAGGDAHLAVQPQALGLGPGVADLEAGYRRGGGQNRPHDEAGSRSAGDDPDVDDALAPAIERRVEEGPEPGDPVLGAGEPAVEHVEGAAEDHDESGRRSHAWPAAAAAAAIEIRKPIDGQGVGGQAEPARAERDRGDSAADARARLLRDERLVAHQCQLRGPTVDGRDGRRCPGGRARARPPRSKTLGRSVAADLAAGALGLDHAGGLEAAHVPRDERLAEADGLDQLADRGRALGQAAARCAGGSRRRGPCGRRAARADRRADRRSRRRCCGCVRGTARCGPRAGSWPALTGRQQTSLYIKAG